MKNWKKRKVEVVWIIIMLMIVVIRVFTAVIKNDDVGDKMRMRMRQRRGLK